jgi:hypothetical protein
MAENLPELAPDEYYIPIRGAAVSTISEMQRQLGVETPNALVVKSLVLLRKLLPYLDEEGNLTVIPPNQAIYPPDMAKISVVDV